MRQNMVVWLRYKVFGFPVYNVISQAVLCLQILEDSSAK